MDIIVAYEIATEWKKRKKQKRESERKSRYTNNIVANIFIGIILLKSIHSFIIGA